MFIMESNAKRMLYRDNFRYKDYVLIGIAVRRVWYDKEIYFKIDFNLWYMNLR